MKTVHNDVVKLTKTYIMNYRFSLILALCLCSDQPARADSTMEYGVTQGESKPGKVQTVVIKDGKILIKDVGGNGKLDFIYSAKPEILFIVDHAKRSVMTLDENQVNQIAKQSEAVQPLLQGFGEQVGKLDPAQRAKWEAMLGGKIHLDTIAEAAKPVQAGKIVKTGQTRKVAEIVCQPMTVWQGKEKTAEVCMAEPAKLNLSGPDYDTLRSLFDFLERVSSKTQVLAKQFGLNLPNLNLHEVSGVPIELRDLTNPGQGSLSMRRVVASAESVDVMKVPDGYQFGPFKLWK